MPLLDRIHPDAERIGAVNTVIKQPDGSLEGRNSDAFGFLAALQEGAPQWRAAAGPVVVLGAGGAARAVVCSLVDAGVPELRLINRTQASATALGLCLHAARRPADHDRALGRALRRCSTARPCWSTRPRSA